MPMSKEDFRAKYAEMIEESYREYGSWAIEREEVSRESVVEEMYAEYVAHPEWYD